MDELELHPNDHPLIKRGVFMLRAQIDTPFDLFKYWSLAGVWRDDVPGWECTPCWFEGLDRVLHIRFT